MFEYFSVTEFHERVIYSRLGCTWIK